MTQRILEIKDQVAPNLFFEATYNFSDRRSNSWKGRFYRVAADTAQAVVPEELKQNPLKLALWSIFTTTSAGLTLDQASFEHANYHPATKSLITEQDIATAQRLFFEGAPAQAWLLLAIRLVEPRQLGITIADARTSIYINLKKNKFTS